MDAKAVFDQGYLQRLHHDQPMSLCEHDVMSIGNTSLLFSRDESITGFVYSFILYPGVWIYETSVSWLFSPEYWEHLPECA